MHEILPGAGHAAAGADSATQNSVSNALISVLNLNLTATSASSRW
jgi:hypothetical protein